MSCLECWADIPDKNERETVMSWVREGKFESFSEVGIRVYVTYRSNPNDPEDSARRWGVIHFFEQYPNHGIFNTA